MLFTKEKAVNQVIEALQPNVYSDNHVMFEKTKKALAKLTKQELSDLDVVILCQTQVPEISADYPEIRSASNE